MTGDTHQRKVRRKWGAIFPSVQHLCCRKKFLKIAFLKHSNFQRFVFVLFFPERCLGDSSGEWKVGMGDACGSQNTVICAQLTHSVIQRQLQSTSKAHCLVKLPSVKFIQQLDRTLPTAVAGTKAPCVQSVSL